MSFAMLFNRKMSLVLLAGLAMPVAGQVSAHGNAQASAHLPQGSTQIPTQLLGGFSSKSAHAGQSILAKLAQPATLADGSSLPGGSQLMGHLTEVKSLSSGSGTSSLKMLFDQAKTPDGQIKKISSTVQSIGGKATAAPASTAPSGGGGLLGGVVGTVGGVVNTAGGLVGTLTGLPGVLLGADGSLSAQGKDVTVPAGTAVTLNISVQ